MKLFVDRLIAAIKEKKTPCIVGLDPVVDKMPATFLAEHEITATSSLAARAEAIYRYNLIVLDAVSDLVPAVKPQAAYYEMYGSVGFEALEKTMQAARDRDLLVILDVKRGDIASTAAAYAQSYLPSLPPRPFEADAITVVPYLGEDCLAPFFQQAIQWGKGIFVCVKTSNPGAAIIQEQKIGDRFLYEIIGDLIIEASSNSIGESGYSGIGAVVGATYPEAAYRLRQQLPHSLFLVPGVGAQGGGNAGIKACFNNDGLGAIISSSRAIMYPHLYGSSQLGDKQTSQVLLSSAIRQAAINLIQQVGEII